MLLYKLQIGCLLFVLLIFIMYEAEKIRTYGFKKLRVFDYMLVIGLVYMILDISTVYCVNHLDTVNPVLNRVLHFWFLLSIDVEIFLFFYYILVITDWIHEQDRLHRFLVCVPLLVNMVIAVFSIGSLEYRVGKMSNYSMGVTAYTCYATATVYVLLMILMFCRRLSYIERDKRRILGITIVTVTGIFLFQMLVPDSLVSCLGITVILVMIYANIENPAKNRLDQYHDELMHGFANIIESRDDSTGGHVKRTSAYVYLLAVELRKQGYYTNVLTKDYIQNLTRAAALHDIGKIAIPDAILQKPGRLTAEEFDIMKGHTTEGGRLIHDSLSMLGDKDEINMAYDVAMYHHERWGGGGYPTGISGTQIPLAARIMAVADVFDAIAEKRCYRDAMSLDESFRILEEGSGTQFQPELITCFLKAREQVEKIQRQLR